MKYNPILAVEVCRGIESGIRSVASYSRLYELDSKEVYLWYAHYRLYGPKFFDQQQTYTSEMRIRIVEDKLNNGLSMTETCLKYKILHRYTLRKWIRRYKNSRLEQMTKKKPTNKQTIKQDNERNTSDTKRIQELERELLYVRAENAYLKKLQALMQETRKS